MNVVRLFRRHLTLAVRLQAGKPLTGAPSAFVEGELLGELLEKAEKTDVFVAGSMAASKRGALEDSVYAVSALIDQDARVRYGNAWKARNPDPKVGHTFYDKLQRRRSLAGTRDDVVDLFVLCILLGYRGHASAHADQDVRAAVRDVVRESDASHFESEIQPATALPYDPTIRESYVRARLAVLLLIGIAVVASIVVRWVAWLGLP